MSFLFVVVVVSGGGDRRRCGLRVVVSKIMTCDRSLWSMICVERQDAGYVLVALLNACKLCSVRTQRINKVRRSNEANKSEKGKKHKIKNKIQKERTNERTKK